MLSREFYLTRSTERVIKLRCKVEIEGGEHVHGRVHHAWSLASDLPSTQPFIHHHQTMGKPNISSMKLGHCLVHHPLQPSEWIINIIKIIEVEPTIITHFLVTNFFFFH